MKFKINSIKNRILTGFLSILVVVLALGILSLYYQNRINQVSNLERLLSRIESHSLHLIKTDNDFFDIESINESYFVTRESKVLDKSNELREKIAHEVESYRAQKGRDILRAELDKVERTLEEYDQHFQVLTEKIYQRGFKDYGLEGKMRTYAHRLESFTQEIKLSHILSLRRHEKDFFLRNDTTYIVLLNRRAQDIYSSLEASNASDSAKVLIIKYVNTFNELVGLQKEIGLNSNEGLRNELNDLTMLLEDHFNELSSKSETWALQLTDRILVLYSVVLAVVIVLTVIWGNFVANKLSRPVKRLDAVMRGAAQKDLKGLIEVPLNNPSSEMENLYQSFIALMKKTKLQMKEIKDKSKRLHKQNQELTKVNHELDSFVYSTAHDLRSPLASLLGLVNLAEREDAPYEKEEYIFMMKQSIQKMDSFIKDVVAYSKNKKLDLTNSQFNLRELIDGIFEEHKFMENAELIEKSIKIGGSETVKNDESRFKIIFNNLVSNAIRYSDIAKPAPKISIDIEVTQERISVVFSDNGIGIAQEYLDKIFKMFFRASENSPGSGLGLFILMETVKKLGGSISVSSELTVGTSFFLELPNNPKRNAAVLKPEGELRY